MVPSADLAYIKDILMVTGDMLGHPIIDPSGRKQGGKELSLLDLALFDGH